MDALKNLLLSTGFGSPNYYFGDQLEGPTWLNIKLYSWLSFITARDTGQE